MAFVVNHSNLTNHKEGAATTSGSGTTFVTSGIVLTTQDIGRLIVMTSGAQRGEFRRIVGIDNQFIATLDNPFSVHPFRAYTRSDGSAFPAAEPETGDTFVLSTSMLELQAAVTNNDVFATQGNYFYINSTGSSDNVDIGERIFIFAENETINVDMRNFRIHTTSGLILGYVNGNGTEPNALPYSENGCRLIDRSSAPFSNRGNDGGARPADQSREGTYGDIHMYGTNVQGSTVVNHLPFWRLYRDNDHILRFFETRFNLRTGMRLRGETSIVLDCSFRGGANRLGKFNPTFEGDSFFGLSAEVTINNTDQGLYWWWDQSFSGAVSGLSGSQITNQLVFFNAAVSPTAIEHRLTLRNVDVDVLENSVVGSGTFWSANNPQGQNKFLTLENELDVAVVNPADNSLFTTTPVRYAQQDAQNNQLSPVDSSTGRFPTRRLTLENISILNTGGSGNLNQANNSANQFAPYSYAVHARGFLPSYRSTALRTQENVTLAGVRDFERTELIPGIINTYTSLSTPERIYDYQSEQRFSNPYAPLLLQDFITKSGNTLSSAFNVVFDNTADAEFSLVGSTLTIKPDVNGYTGGINVGNSTVSFDNTIRGSVTADAIIHSFTSGSIIDTTGAINGVMNLPGGEYSINGADIQGLTINRADLGIVTIIITNTSGTATAGTGVVISAPQVQGSSVTIPLSQLPPNSSYIIRQNGQELTSGNAIDSPADIVYGTGLGLPAGAVDNLTLLEQAISLHWTARSNFTNHQGILAQANTSTEAVLNVTLLLAPLALIPDVPDGTITPGVSIIPSATLDGDERVTITVTGTRNNNWLPHPAVSINAAASRNSEAYLRAVSLQVEADEDLTVPLTGGALQYDAYIVTADGIASKGPRTFWRDDPAAVGIQTVDAAINTIDDQNFSVGSANAVQQTVPSGVERINGDPQVTFGKRELLSAETLAALVAAQVATAAGATQAQVQTIVDGIPAAPSEGVIAAAVVDVLIVPTAAQNAMAVDTLLDLDTNFATVATAQAAITTAIETISIPTAAIISARVASDLEGDFATIEGDLAAINTAITAIDTTSGGSGATQAQVQTIVNSAQGALIGHIYGAS